ncbi:MAG: UvrD-helicase domain-containing protein [Candidatus Competibacteraceae bacterium]|nr:UvrD-helicase domain-containing protein [Candidatus Competibacteraceae bacterium]
MDISLILDDLNDAQRQAVSAPPGPLRVLAGAGSGKTRVLTRRIAWLLTVEQASPWSILAVTFTNKAAAEMRGRVEQLLGSTMSGLWIGTFHSIAHRLLRMHWQEAKLPRTFQVLDADDQQRLVKRVIRALALDEKNGRRNKQPVLSMPVRIRDCAPIRSTMATTRCCGSGCASTKLIRNSVSGLRWWISANYYCAFTNYGGILPNWCNTTGSAFNMCWSMNSKIPIPSSISHCGC